MGDPDEYDSLSERISRELLQTADPQAVPDPLAIALRYANEGTTMPLNDLQALVLQIAKELKIDNC